jgi:hypothetical protein
MDMSINDDIFPDARFEVITAVKIEFVVLSFVVPCSVVARYQHFRMHFYI